MSHGRGTALLLAAAWGLTAPAGRGEVAAIGAPVDAPRVALVLEFLGVGDGSHILARHREVVDVGMRLDVQEVIARRSADGQVRSRCRLAISTESHSRERVGLEVRSQVTDVGGSETWERQRSLVLSSGTSALMEIAPAVDTGEALVVSITLQLAGSEPLSAPPVEVEVMVGVYAVDGDREAIIQAPYLRTLSGRPASFSFDYPMPSMSPGHVDRVRFAVRLTPGYPRRGHIPVRLELDGELPAPDGPVRVNRDESTLVPAGRRWTVPVRPPAGDGPGLRLEIAVAWRPAPSWADPERF